jgi:peptidyl-prolyl cis-trans isomerase C
MTRRFGKTIGVVFVALAILSGCGSSSKNKSTVVAKVGDSELTVRDILKNIPDDPALKVSGVQVEQYVQRWIDSEVIYQEAIRSGIMNSQEMKERIEKLTRDAVISAYLDEMVESKATVTPDEIRQFYEENKESFVREDNQYHVLVILTDSYQNANALRRRIINGEDFAQVARDNSLDASKQAGGDLGWVTLDQLSPALARTIPSLSLKRISTPVNTEVGYEIVQMLDVRKRGELKTLDEVKDVITMRLLTMKKERRYNDLVSNLTENSDIHANWQLLRKVVSDSLGNK